MTRMKTSLSAFVSGQLMEKFTIRQVFARLEQIGVRVTHDWTTTDDLTEYERSSSEAGARAARDISGVCNADIYILMSDNRLRGKGMYVELGAALASAAIGGKRAVYIVGPMNHASIFYYHPTVHHFVDIDACIAHIQEAYAITNVTSSRRATRRGRRDAA